MVTQSLPFLLRCTSNPRLFVSAAVCQFNCTCVPDFTAVKLTRRTGKVPVPMMDKGVPPVQTPGFTSDQEQLALVVLGGVERLQGLWKTGWPSNANTQILSGA